MECEVPDKKKVQFKKYEKEWNKHRRISVELNSIPGI